MKRLFFFILFMGLLVSFGNQGWLKLLKLKTLEQGLEKENRSLAAENESFKKTITHLKDPQYVETYIRRELGYIKGNELLFELGADTP